MIVLDLQSRQPIYEQLGNKICELAMLGRLNPGDQLPSVRSFARELGINPNTVQKAYQDLERDGVIYSVSGKGCFLSDRPQLRGLLERQYLSKITTAAKEAKQCGLTLEQVIKTVQSVYEEDSKL